MRRATITITDEFERALDEFVAAQPARPSLTSVLEAALGAHLAPGSGEPQHATRLIEVVRRRDQLVTLARSRGALALGLFGSVSRGSDGPESDVDFWVEAGPDMGLFDLAAVREDFSGLLGTSVDVVTLGGLTQGEQSELRAASLVL